MLRISSKDLSASVEQAATLVQEAVHPDALTIFGATFDETLEDEIRVTVIATGFAEGNKEEPAPAEEQKPEEQSEEDKPDTTEADKSFEEILSIFNRKF